MRIIKIALAGILMIVPLPLQSQASAACSGARPSWLAASPDEADVQSCINVAVNGDTIRVRAGAATWATSVSWTNKAISVIGAGIDQTVITLNNNTAFVVIMNAGGVNSWRISGFTFTGAHNMTFNISSGTVNVPTKGWRIDHVRLNNTGGSSGWGFFSHGITWGLMDHLVIDGTPFPFAAIYGYLDTADESTSCSPHCFGFSYWNRDLNLGSDEAIYIEDSVINFDGTGGAPSVQDLMYGGSVVIRHNTIKGAFFQTHATRYVQHGGMKYEVYNNTFTGMGFYRPAQLRSGTGVIFNNTVTGYSLQEFSIDGQREGTACQLTAAAPLNSCNGTSPYDGNLEPSGWPCLGGCGRGAVANWDERGRTLSNTPIYAWKNGTTATCATGGTCDNTVLVNLNGACGPSMATYLRTPSAPHANGQFDYVNNGNTPKPGYTPYAYPHPNQAGSTSGNNAVPPTPLNLMVR